MRANSIRLLWVPDEHSSEVGNEKANRTANRGTRSIRATRRSIRIPKCCLEEQPSKTWLTELRKFERWQFRLVIGWLIENWKVNSHLFKMGLSQSVD